MKTTKQHLSLIVSTVLVGVVIGYLFSVYPTKVVSVVDVKGACADGIGFGYCPDGYVKLETGFPATSYDSVVYGVDSNESVPYEHRNITPNNLSLAINIATWTAVVAVVNMSFLKLAKKK